MADFKKSFDEKDNSQVSNKQVEDIKRSNCVADELTDLSAIEETAASKAVWVISFTISLGGFLFGYDTGYISSVLVTLGAGLGHKLSSSEEELVTSLTSECYRTEALYGTES